LKKPTGKSIACPFWQYVGPSVAEIWTDPPLVWQVTGEPSTTFTVAELTPACDQTLATLDAIAASLCGSGYPAKPVSLARAPVR
jgi:hypothetical protein